MNTATILLVDDEPLNLMLYSEILKKEGYSISTAIDGLDAIEKTMQLMPDAIIMDWNMPRMDGLEALTKIKSQTLTSEIPVIMITGIMTLPENLKHALETGAVDFLRKPFDKVELLARTRSVLQLAKSKKELKERYETIELKNQFIHSLIESIPHPMVYYGITGLIHGYNHLFEQLFKNSNKQIDNSSIYDLFIKKEADLHKKKDQELLKTKTEIAYESGNGLNNDEFIFTKSLYYTTPGTPQGIMCVMTNITALKNAHHEIMESKKRELTSSALRLIQISEINNNLINEFEKINEFTNKEGKDYIRKTVKQFNFNNNDNVWQEFETRFQNVYESFYIILSERFPDLTTGEKKLCALLKLNLSSKEIAAITSQNPQSIDVARYRLRKKMNLAQDENLVEFLMKIN